MITCVIIQKKSTWAKFFYRYVTNIEEGEEEDVGEE